MKRRRCASGFGTYFRDLFIRPPKTPPVAGFTRCTRVHAGHGIAS
jgi:hypothetical protein